MIKRCVFKNVGCLRDVTVDFEPLTAFVGPNASGKSTLLKALQWPTLAPHVERWQKDPSLPLSVDLLFDTGSRWLRRRQPGGSDEQEGERRTSGYYQLLRLEPDQLRQANETQAEPALNFTGGNLTNVFATLPREHQIEVSNALAALIPVIRAVDVAPGTKRGHQELRFWDRFANATWYSPQEVSDGTMLLVAFLVLQHQSLPLETIGIEEPERGLHPYLLEQVVHLLRDLAHGRLGPRAIQVVLATHSPELLDALRPEEVRFMDRMPDGSVKVEAPPTDSPSFQQAIEAYHDALGAAWLAGGLGGVPGP